MRFALLLTAVCLPLIISQTASCETFWQKLQIRAPCWPSHIGNYCHDDYQRKCEPTAKPVCKFHCDDYCRKCEPCPKKVECFKCDDYCKKCPPIQRRPSCADLRCPLPLACPAK